MIYVTRTYVMLLGHAKDLRCEITSGPVQARMTRRELQNELESLRRSVKPSTNVGGAALATTAATSSSPRRSSHGLASDSGLHQSPSSQSQSVVEREALPTFPGEGSTSEPTHGTPTSNGTVLVDNTYTLSRSLDDLIVGSEIIDACFDMSVCELSQAKVQLTQCKIFPPLHISCACT